MKDYVRTNYVNASQVDDYLSEGWEIIETTTSLIDPGGETRLVYHIGLTARELMNKYKGIIKDYEKYNLQDILFEKIADSYNKDIDNYEVLGSGGKDEVSKYLTNYERTVEGNNTTYSIKRKLDEEISF